VTPVLTAEGTTPTSPAEVLVELAAAAALAVPGVTRLHPGSFGEAATYFPGRRFTGVRLREDILEVHVVVEWGRPVRPVAHAVLAALEGLVVIPVHVRVGDVSDPTSPDHP